MPEQTLIPGAAPLHFCMRISKKSKSTAEIAEQFSSFIFTPRPLCLCGEDYRV